VPRPLNADPLGGGTVPVRVQELVHRSPVASAFAAASTLVFVATLFAPGFTLPLMLSPVHVLSGYLWQPVTYALFPAGLLNWAVVIALVLYFGWHLEPLLGRRRSLALYVTCPLASGLVYVLLIKTPAPFAGGAFLATGLGAAYLSWSIFCRQAQPRLIWTFWAFAGLYVCLVLLGSPLYLLAPSLVAWVLAFIISLAPIKRAAAQHAVADGPATAELD
jgi:membrane associated rhomboid family serine protease